MAVSIATTALLMVTMLLRSPHYRAGGGGSGALARGSPGQEPPAGDRGRHSGQPWKVPEKIWLISPTQLPTSSMAVCTAGCSPNSPAWSLDGDRPHPPGRRDSRIDVGTER